MQPKTLSSAETFIMKIIFPTIWILLFGSGTFGLWFGADAGASGNSVPPETKWEFLFFWIVGTLFILWGCARLKRVRIDHEFLYVSNFLKETPIPLSLIHSVTENRWLNIHPVTIHFEKPTEFGLKVVFMPKVRLFGFFSSHPVVEELRLAAGIKRGASQETHPK